MKAHKIAVDIVHTLNGHNYTAYFAGGWVRDHVMGNESSDIDIATDASPEKILHLFPRTLLVGISFGVVIVIIDGHKFEVATFRRDVEYTNGRSPESIVFCSPKEDALRRDFTINGLFYNPLTHEIFDYVDGVNDIKKGVIRTIGNPHERFVEDRLRMIRAFRFASRFGFAIDPETQEAIYENADTLFPSVSVERIWQEFNKMSKYPSFDKALIEMHRLELLPVIFPQLKEVHLNDIKHRVLYFSHFPKETPTILYLTHLFPESSKEEMFNLCRYLHTSKQEMMHLDTFFRAKELVQKEMRLEGHYDATDWARYFAKKDASLCLEVVTANFKKEEQEKFLKNHRNRAEQLKIFSDRIAKNSPLISGKDLLDRGFNPGEAFGQILDEAERYSINNNIHDPQLIIDHLKQTKLWQTHQKP